MGRRLTDDVIAHTSELVTNDSNAHNPTGAHATYQAEMIRVMTRRSLKALRDRQERAQWPATPVTLWGKVADGRFPTGTAFRASQDATAPMTAVVNGTRFTRKRNDANTLLDWLRDRLGLTGTKNGCAEGACGACTVHMDGMAVLSCMVPAGRAQGADIVTIEGLANGDTLHPLQRVFIEHGASQCGFCIPGILMSSAKLLDETNQPTTQQTRNALQGNLCRCTGYYKIVSAIERAAEHGLREISDDDRKI